MKFKNEKIILLIASIFILQLASAVTLTNVEISDSSEDNFNSGGSLILVNNSNVNANGLELNNNGDCIFIHPTSELEIT